jgi:hypothetical protein
MKTKKRFMVVGGIALLFSTLMGSMVVEAWGPERWLGRDFHEGPCGSRFHRGFRGGKDLSDFMLWRMDEKAKDLNLNAAQKEKYDELRTSVKSRFAEAAESRRALRRTIRTEMEKEVPHIESLAPRLKTAINHISATMQETVDLVVAFNASLDTDQKKKLASGFRHRMGR